MAEKSSDRMTNRFPAVDVSRYTVILVRPETPENVGLAARVVLSEVAHQLVKEGQWPGARLRQARIHKA